MQEPSDREPIRESTAFRAAAAHIRATDERTLAEQILLSEIEAPPFGEAARGARMAELMTESGLVDVRSDGVGNVLAWFPDGGSTVEPGSRTPPVVVSAHLDTVFAAGTDVSVRREGDRLFGPGIVDDARGLTVLLALARALRVAEATPGRPLLFAATVGEEGVGDLRGVRHLFGPDGEARDAYGFVSIDGAGLDRIVNEAVGSRRYRISVRGPGGHSWSDYGLANPIHALGDAVARLTRLALPDGTTLNVGRIEGGTSVNAIPERAWIEAEIRSVNEAHLVEVDVSLRERVTLAVADENNRRRGGTPEAMLEFEPIGNRPGGATPDDTPLVRAALAATESMGEAGRLASASTDANVPMSLGIQAVTLGGGGQMGGAHTLGEWYDNTRGPLGVERALLTLLLLDEMA